MRGEGERTKLGRGKGLSKGRGGKNQVREGEGTVGKEQIS